MQNKEIEGGKRRRHQHDHGGIGRAKIVLLIEESTEHVTGWDDNIKAGFSVGLTPYQKWNCLKEKCFKGRKSKLI